MIENAAMVIPFRDRGDERRARNLRMVLRYYGDVFKDIFVQTDGRLGTEQFNRSAAYNRGVENARRSGADVIVFCEADMIVPYGQIKTGIRLASEQPGLVIPFTERCEIDDVATESLSQEWHDPFLIKPVTVYSNGFSMGAVNIVSMDTMHLIGQWDETFEGNGYDDNAMFRAFEIATRNKARYITGPSVHLWHVPGFAGEHLSDEDRSATDRNRIRFETQYQRARNYREIRLLTAGGTI